MAIAKVTDFNCSDCGAVAERGFVVEPLHIPSFFLQLHCPVLDHNPWTVASNCPTCGKVPEYRTIMDGDVRVPALYCCEGLWTPVGAVGNSFLDERNI